MRQDDASSEFKREIGRNNNFTNYILRVINDSMVEVSSN